MLVTLKKKEQGKKGGNEIDVNARLTLAFQETEDGSVL